MKRVLRNNNGDTIVEVLIAIAVISLILGGAFVSTRRSSAAVRTAQEQGEALKIAEKQVELLKVAFATGIPDLTAVIPPFCMADTTPLTAPPAANPACTSGLYSSSIDKPSASSYRIQVTWSSLNGSLQNRVELDYSTQ